MTELLAPVGNIQALKSAVASKADAVYLGMDLFNARIKADNFTIENIKKWVDYCHLFNVKVYVTFNTNVKESELNQFEPYAQACKEASVDAFIVTDFAIVEKLKNFDIPLHASTQMGVHNLAGARLLEKLGFSRVVLARESLEKDIVEIKQNTKLEIEYFVHGALCVSFSGGCLLSSMMNGDSGNRGKCNQPCRLEYKNSFNSKTEYLLSTADQCLIHKLDRLIYCGVDSLKIEGRLKQPHYVGTVVEQYRKYLDTNILNTTMLDSLKKAYNRGDFTEGYNYDDINKIVYPDVQGNIGKKIGNISVCLDGNIHIETKYALQVGDGLKIICDNKELGGLGVTKLYYKGSETLIESNKTFPRGSEVRLTLDSRQVEKFDNIFTKRKIVINCKAKIGKQLEINMESGRCKETYLGNIVEKAEKNATDESSIKKQLSKLGDTNFSLESATDIIVTIDKNIFIPLSSLNIARRELLSLLENALLKKYSERQVKIDFTKFLELLPQQEGYVDNAKPFVVPQTLEMLANKDFTRKCNIVVEFDEKTGDLFASILQNGINENNILNNTTSIYLKLPRIARGKDIDLITNFLKKFKKYFVGIICDNLYAVQLAKDFSLFAIGGIGLNIYNEFSAKLLGLENFISSAELTCAEQLKMRKEHIVFAYGELPVMTFCHCPIQLNTKCSCVNCKYTGDFYYFDKISRYKITRTKLAYCYFIMRNPQKIDIRNKISKIPYNYFIDLSSCDKMKIDELISNFISRSGESEENTTSGHLFRGVK